MAKLCTVQLFFMKQLLGLVIAVVLLNSCGNYKQIKKDYLLFQSGVDSLPKPAYKPLKIEARDILNIQFYTESTRSLEQINLYNSASEGRGGKMSVDENGFVEIPSIGKVKAAGLTCKELADTINIKIRPYIKSSGVFVKMEGIKISVMGEVGSPGIKNFTDERVTLIDAMSLSGGFADMAQRNDVLVIREDSGMRKSYVVNFQDAKELYNSPAYQLKQNDLVFVRPSDAKYRSINNQNIQQKVQPILSYSSVTSFFLSLVLISISLFK